MIRLLRLLVPCRGAARTNALGLQGHAPGAVSWAAAGEGNSGLGAALVRSRELLSTLALRSQPLCLLESSPVCGLPCAQG